MTNLPEVKAQYADRYPVLQRVAKKLEIYLRSLLDDTPRIDAVNSRAKAPDRFLAKAFKEDSAGNLKYDNPLYQIQDQLGGRITVFYLSDVDAIRFIIEKYVRHIEMLDKAPSNESEFGYFGVHFILKLPEEVVPDDVDADSIPDFFELQIKTLFQHAWSEAHHDLGYKSIRDLTSDEKRKVAFTAAQAWGADTIFEQLAKELCTNDNSPSQEA